MIILYKRFRRNILILFMIFTLVIIVFLSYVDMKRVTGQLTVDHIERIDLAELNVKTALKQWNEEYIHLDEQIAQQMKANSEILLEKYEENPHFNEWDFDALKNQFNMDVYIINRENEVIYSSFQQDVGLKFNSCCDSFGAFLDERRKNGVFVDDVIDLQKDVGELKKYSYMPTKDGQYILELSYMIERDPLFQQFAFVTVMNDLKVNYPFIRSVSIFNEDYYEFNRSNINANCLNDECLNTDDWFDCSTKLKEKNYILLNNRSNNDREQPSMKVVEIVYDNSSLKKALQESKLIFYIQVIGTFLLAVISIVFIYKIIEKPMYLAFHDRLTGLKNRAAFENEVQRLIEKNNTRFGLLLLDFDNFKKVNDTLGHDQGDILLKFVANYIKTKLPDNTFFARFGGDEFIILVRNIQNQHEVEQLANRIIQLFLETPDTEQSTELFVRGFQIVSQCDVTVSIGGAVYPQDGKDGDTLYKKADIALYYSKEHGKCRYTYY